MVHDRLTSPTPSPALTDDDVIFALGHPRHVDDVSRYLDEATELIDMAEGFIRHWTKFRVQVVDAKRNLELLAERLRGLDEVEDTILPLE